MNGQANDDESLTGVADFDVGRIKEMWECSKYKKIGQFYSCELDHPTFEKLNLGASSSKGSGLFQVTVTTFRNRGPQDVLPIPWVRVPSPYEDIKRHEDSH